MRARGALARLAPIIIAGGFIMGGVDRERILRVDRDLPHVHYEAFSLRELNTGLSSCELSVTGGFSRLPIGFKSSPPATLGAVPGGESWSADYSGGGLYFS